MDKKRTPAQDRALFSHRIDAMPSPRTTVSTALAAALLCAAAPWAGAQTTLSPQTAAAIASQAAPPATATPALTPRQGSGGTRFISGGAGNEERTRMDSQRSEFPLKVVLSAGKGEYIVAEQFRLSGGKGGAAIDVADVGPWVMIKAPAGSYTLDVTYQGKTQHRTVKVGKGASEVNLRFPG